MVDHTLQNNDVMFQTTSNESDALKPISLSERMISMDILRGFALIGILFMNIEWFTRPIAELMVLDLTLTGADYTSSWLVLLFVQGKFYKLFSLLFGMGFAVMMLRAQQKGRPFTAWFLRRMFVLLLIGYAHLIFLWEGDILHDYALGGIFMLLFMLLLRTKKLSRFNNPDSIGKFAVGLMLAPLIITMIVGSYYGASNDTQTLESKWQERQQVEALFQQKKAAYNPENNKDWPLAEVTQEQPEVENPAADTEGEELSVEEKAQKRYERFVKRDAKVQKEIDVFKNGNYDEIVSFRMASVKENLADTIFMSLAVLLAIFLLGYWFVASKKIENAEEHKTFFKTLAWVGLTLGFMLNLGPVLVLSHPSAQDSQFIKTVMMNMMFFGQTVLMLGYVGLMVLMIMKPRIKRMLSWMAPLGQMALTNYIMHSLILTTFFYGYGYGMYGEVSRLTQMYIVVGIILFQVVFSVLWLKAFRFGPLEWIWRSLTYMKIQPIVR